MHIATTRLASFAETELRACWRRYTSLERDPAILVAPRTRLAQAAVARTPETMSRSVEGSGTEVATKP